jgi:hypothetical protein
MVFGITTKDALILNRKELEKGEFLDLAEFENRMKVHNFLPETEILFGILKGYLSSQSLQKI